MSMDDAFPPFEPDGPEGDEETRRKRLREIPFRFIVPNIITLLAICAGVSGIRLAIENRFDDAVMMVLLAAFLDGVDGRVARLVKGTSKFGAEMDSLADVINFGVAPALVLYLYALEETRNFGWVAALVYVIACALRLARFNTMAGDRTRPKWQQGYFIGIPAPAGALLVLLPVYLGFLGIQTDIYYGTVVALFTIAIAFLMVSNLPVWSGKTLGARIRRTAVMPLFLVVVLYVALLASYTWSTLACTALAYLAFLPWSVRMWRKAALRAAQSAQNEDANA